MKVAIIGSRGYPYVYSGYETFVKELVERLVKMDVDVTVYCHKNLFKQYPKNINGVNLIYIKTIEKKSLSQFIHSFQSIIHACFCKYDLILVVNSANGLFGIFTRIFRKKTAINVDGLEWLRPKWKGIGAKYFFFASKLATLLYDCIITDSIEMQKIYKQLFNAESEMIVYGANIRDSVNPSIIEKWGIKKNEYYLIVGRLIPDNNSDIIVSEFLKSKSNKHLVVVGDVPYKDTYAEKIKNINDRRLIFTGYITNQDELAELYHNCYAYFHGHEFGGTNPTMLKAMAYNAPIVALDTVFNREMLDGGKYGIFFTKEDNNLRNIINYIETDEGEMIISNLRGKARDKIITYYNWDMVAESYYRLFNRMLKET